MFKLTTNLEIFYKCSPRLFFFLILNKNVIGKIAVKENDKNVIFCKKRQNLCKQMTKKKC